MDNTSQTDNVLSKFTPAALELLRHANGGLVNLNLFCRIEPDSDWGRSWDGIKFDFMLKKAPIYRECGNIRSGRKPYTEVWRTSVIEYDRVLSTHTNLDAAMKVAQREEVVFISLTESQKGVSRGNDGECPHSVVPFSFDRYGQRVTSFVARSLVTLNR